MTKPETLATAIRIGDPVSWPKALHEVRTSGGTVEKVTEQEIADAKAQIGLCGIGCEPASAATLAGIRKLTARGVIDRGADVVAVLTGNVLKDPDYIYRYHTGQLEAPGGVKIQSTFGNKPIVVPERSGQDRGIACVGRLGYDRLPLQDPDFVVPDDRFHQERQRAHVGQIGGLGIEMASARTRERVPDLADIRKPSRERSPLYVARTCAATSGDANWSSSA